MLSVILLLLLSSFTGAARVRETLSSRAREFRQIRLVLDRIGTDLICAFATSAREESALSLREDLLSGLRVATLTFTAFQLPDGDNGHPPSEIVKIRDFPKSGPTAPPSSCTGSNPTCRSSGTRSPSGDPRWRIGCGASASRRSNGTNWTKEWPAGGGSKTLLPKKVAVTLVGERGETYRREVPIRLAGQEGNVTWSGRRSAGKP